MKIVCKRTSDQDEVCELLSSFSENGWNLSSCYTRVTHGPGGYTVFYDERLEHKV